MGSLSVALHWIPPSELARMSSSTLWRSLWVLIFHFRLTRRLSVYYTSISLAYFHVLSDFSLAADSCGRRKSISGENAARGSEAGCTDLQQMSSARFCVLDVAPAERRPRRLDLQQNGLQMIGFHGRDEEDDQHCVTQEHLKLLIDSICLSKTDTLLGTENSSGNSPMVDFRLAPFGPSPTIGACRKNEADARPTFLRSMPKR